MEYVKTAISVPRAIFEEAEAYAAEHKLTRSSLVAKALEDFLYREETRRMMAAIDEVCSLEPTEEDLAADEFRRGLVRRYTRGLATDEDNTW